MDYYLYVIRSGNSQYVGVTSNLRERIRSHNAGENKATKHKNNWELKHCERCKTLGEAKGRESYIKRMKKRYGQKFCFDGT